MDPADSGTNKTRAMMKLSWQSQMISNKVFISLHELYNMWTEIG